MTPAGRDLVAGIGFRHAHRRPTRSSPSSQRACDAAGLPRARLARLATAADRAGEPAIRAAAEALGLSRWTRFRPRP